MKVLCQILQPKGSGNSSNKGISSYHTSVILTDEETPTIGMIPTVKIVKRPYLNYIHAEPMFTHNLNDSMIGPMAGGCFLYSSDSNYNKLVGHDYPISLHDRYETAEQYEILSR